MNTAIGGRSRSSRTMVSTVAPMSTVSQIAAAVSNGRRASGRNTIASSGG